MSTPDKNARSHIKRNPGRGVYERETIDAILDANLLCHVAFVIDGEPRVLPTVYVRRGDAIYLHGHRRNGMLNALVDERTACVNVTSIDGLVLARSGFHHSANYRSVVLFGKPALVAEEDKRAILDDFVDRMAPGRAADVRPATPQELNATLVLRIPIEEASAKVRAGPPVDDAEDYALDVWAGVVPIETTFGAVEPCPNLKADIALPGYLQAMIDAEPRSG